MFKIGDRVQKTSPFSYNPHGDISRAMIKNIGTIIDIQYKKKPNSCPLYIVQFDGKSLTNELHHHYTESSLELFR